MRPYLILFLLTLAACSTGPERESLDQFKTLEGDWSMKIGESYVGEVWTTKNDTLLSGYSYEITGNDTVITENLQIVSSPEGIFYIPTVYGQNNDEPVPFRLTQSGEDEFIFENPEHDFPVKISYRFISPGQLRAEVSGPVGGKMRSLEFDYKRNTGN